jgi:RimJ/RimL family protein N-acetyltransferase
MHQTLLNDGLTQTAEARTAKPDISRRPRSSGPLSQYEIAACRSAGIALAYDPVQIGWVRADCDDDIDLAERVVAKPAFAPRSLAPTYRFRPWALDDLQTYRALLDDRKVWAQMYEPYPDPLDDDTARHLIELSGDSPHHEVQAVLRDGHIVGQVRLLFAGDSAELSYWFGRQYWGQGLGSAVVAVHSGRSFVRHARLQALTAVVSPDNAASHRVLLKAGYVEDGPCRKRPGWVSYKLTRARAEAISNGSDRP